MYIRWRCCAFVLVVRCSSIHKVPGLTVPLACSVTEILGAMDPFVCSTCNMSFRSSHFLSKHQEKFCIGYADQRKESDYPQILSERIRELQRKHQQRRSYVRAQNYQQNVHLKMEHQLRKPNSEPVRNINSLTNVLWPQLFTVIATTCVLQYLYPMKICINKCAQTAERADQQIQDPSEIHERWVLQSSDSEKTNKKKRETNQQEPNAQNSKVPQLEKMILDLKAQEQKNTMLLESLMDHLQHNATEPMPVTFKGGDVLQSSNADLLIPETREKLTHIDVPVYRNGGLSSEISTVRVSYLQNGGKDPQILAQLEDLLNEAITVEMLAGRPKNLYTETIKHGPKPKDNKKDLFRELVSTELENQRLEEKIMKLHLRRRKSAFTRTSPEQFQMAFSRTTPNFRRSEQEMRSMKMDIDLLKHEVEINHLGKMTKSRKLGPTLGNFPPLEEPRSQTTPRSRYSMEVSEGFGPAPYDPMAGFVVFYDFLLGLCPSYRVCRLMVGLYSGDQCLGSPSVLPPVYCEPFSLATHPPRYSQGQKAILASKQAVPE
ncbi:hypothetical protein NFI96_028540 [Prochilodus magdalenae]|nr:hypothetical protein NFI96_028540 [Prochilodus magdalenae]